MPSFLDNIRNADRETQIALSVVGFLLLVVFIMALMSIGGDDADAPNRGNGGSSPTPTPTITPTPTATPDAFDPGSFFLDILDPPALEVFVEVPSITISGRTRVDALVTVNDLILAPDADGAFTAVVPLVEGPNIIEVVASISSGEQLDRVIAAIYAP